MDKEQNTTTKQHLPTISIKGKDYVLVKDRVLFFNEHYPNGAIKTDLIKYEDGQVIVCAKVYPDVSVPERYFTGWSQAREGDGFINKTAALENAETSAVGRALAMMGIGVLDSLASVDEIAKAEASDVEPRETFPNRQPNAICKICKSQAEERIGVSKSGRSYHGIFCLRFPKHVEWISVKHNTETEEEEGGEHEAN